MFIYIYMCMCVCVCVCVCIYIYIYTHTHTHTHTHNHIRLHSIQRPLLTGRILFIPNVTYFWIFGTTVSLFLSNTAVFHNRKQN